MLLAGLAEGHMRLFDRIAGCFADFRNPDLIVHEVRSMIGQRILGLIVGLEDLNDHDEFRKDPVLGCMAPRREDCEPLAGKSTLNRLELSAVGFNGKKARKIVANFDRMDELLVELLVENYEEAPREIVLNIDATDFELHGDQEDRFYHGYYDEYCYLPVMMFADRHPVLARLRTDSLDAADGIQDELEGVVGRIRAHWPETRIIVTTDSGFCRDDIMAWCENEENVDYVLGLAKNSRLKELSADAMAEASAETRKTGKACRRFCEFTYRTRKGWFRARRVIAKAEALPGPGGEDETDFPYKANDRYIVTSLSAQSHPAFTRATIVPGAMRKIA